MNPSELRAGAAWDTPEKRRAMVEVVSTDIVTSPPLRLSLRRNFVWTFAGNVVYAACQWGMLVSLAKLGSPEMVGQFALGLAVGAPLMMLANLQLRAVQATDAQNEYRFGEFLALRLLTTVMAFAAICLVAWWAGYRWQTALVVVLVGAAKSIESISDVVYGLMQKHERLDRVAVAMMIRGVGSVVLFAWALALTRNVVWAVVASSTWWGIVLLNYEWRTGRALLQFYGSAGDRFAPSWRWSRLWKLAGLSLPLGMVMVLASLNTNIPRYFVEHFHGEAALGYFAALGYVMVAGYTVMGALGQSATPRLARYRVSDPAAFRRLLTKMLVISAAVGGAGILLAAYLGRPLLTFLYRRDYADYANVFVWVMVAAAISYISSMLGYAMTAARIYRAQVPLFAASCLGIAATCALLVKAHGLLGAAFALVVGASISALGAGGILMFHPTRRKSPLR
jgi:O-antigen/teichoic acid export membrane protein